LALTNSTGSGLYLSGTNKIALAVNGVQALDTVESSPGGFGNVGMGGAASTSDAFPLLIQRTYASTVNVQLSNSSSATAGAGAMFQAVSDAGNNYMEIASFPGATVAPDIYAGGGGVVRFTTSGGTSTDLVLVTDAASNSSIRFYAGGDAVGNKIMTLNSSGLNMFNGLSLNTSGTTSGSVSIASSSGTYNFNLPTTAGSAGQVLTSQGGSSTAMTWTSASSFAITSLTGDITGTGPGATATTLATVNSNVGTFASVTVNGKGLVTAATALSGDATTSGSALTLATVNSNVGTFASVTVNGKGLVTAAAALSGDATTSGSALTLATVNSNVGSFGSSTSIPSFTVNGKGLITAASGNAVIAPAGTLSGTTLNSTVVSSSLTSVGTIGTGVWNGTSVGTTWGGTGLSNPTAHNLLITEGSSNMTLLAPVAGTVLAATSASADPSFSATPTLGVAASLSGTLALASSSASTGLVTLANQGTTSGNAYTFSFPLTGGTNGYALTTNGSGATTWTSVVTNPMSTLGDTIYGGASGAPTRLAGNTTTAQQVLTSTGAASAATAPAWTTLTAPTKTIKTSTGSQAGLLFTISTTSTCAVGDTYTNNSNTYTVLIALAAQSGQVLYMSGTGSTSGTTLTRATGSGTSSITFSTTVALASYTPPTNCQLIKVTVIGGGGGGGGCSSVASDATASAGGGGGGAAIKYISAPSGTYYYCVGSAGTNGSSGANNGSAGGVGAFLSSGVGPYVGNGGSGGTAGTPAPGTGPNSVGGAGGTATLGDLNIAGGRGNNGIIFGITAAPLSGMGGTTILGTGGPLVSPSSGNSAGNNGVGYGDGGSGAAQVNNGGAAAGGSGAAGLVLIEEFYQ
jgi:hypothetical protein